MKQGFLVNNRKTLTTISEAKPNSSFEINNAVFAATNARSEPAVVARLGMPDFAEPPFVDLYNELLLQFFLSFPIIVFFSYVF